LKFINLAQAFLKFTTHSNFKMLTDTDLKQFSRQIILPNFGLEAQKKLKASRVLVIGCGGLGGPAALFLVAAGVGNMGIIDFDVVSLSNLHRQVLFTTDDIGQKKVEIAKIRLSKLYPDAKIIAFDEKLSSQNALEILKNYDLIVDGSDNFPTRYLVNDACEILNKPFVYAAIHQFEAQLAIFNYEGSATYRDIFATPPPPHMAPNCSTGGVLGALAGTVGSMQALEAIKIITGVGNTLKNTMLLMEFGEMYFKKISINKNTERKTVTALIDYDIFCGLNSETANLRISKIAFLNLNPLEYRLIDIRTEQERDIFDIGGEHVEMEEAEEFFESLKEEKTIIFYCATGRRSKVITEKIIKKHSGVKVKFLDADLAEFY
jgi:sulfur-carrier protein adenylyltransferase/sulfurtransferase